MTTESPALTALRTELEAERRARAEAEHRARLAEAVAQERGRALTAGPSTVTPLAFRPETPAEPPPAAEQPTAGPDPHPARSERPRGRLAAWRDRRR